MKIDLHCYALKVKKGELEKRNIDKEQYEQFVNEANGSFQVWPGIELDVENDYKESGHLIKYVKNIWRDINYEVSKTRTSAGVFK